MNVTLARDDEMPAVVTLVEELLTQLGAEAQESAHIDHDRLQTELQGSLASGRFLALLAKDDSGTPQGVLTISTCFALYAGGEYGIIDEMYVRPEYRGRGVGSALMAQAVAIARTRGWRRLDVTGPQEDNTHSAVDFYEAAGFAFTGRKLRLLV